jgi:sulfur-oxidizing protein SoxY
MTMTRRGSLLVGLGGLVALTAPGVAHAARLDDVRNAFVGGAPVSTGGITLTVPQIAEDGSVVPVSVEAPGAVAIMLLASGNPEPAIATIAFGPAAGRQMAVTRVRLAQSQDVIALARMADGSVLETRANVLVTVGGCVG